MKLVAPPYASLEHVDTPDWTHTTAEGPVEVAGVLDGWDPAQQLAFHRTLQLSHDEVMGATGLAPSSRLRVAACWRCDATRTRTRTSSVDVIMKPGCRFETVLECLVDGAAVAQYIFLETCIVLTQAAPGSASHSATAIGSILWAHTQRVDLEGAASRFPTQWVDFSAVPIFPTDAAWFLEWDPSHPEYSVLGSMRLYVNSAHRDVKRIMEGSEKNARRMWHRIRLDVARQMLLGALHSEAFMEDPGAFGGETVGAVTARLLRAVFGDRSASSVKDLLSYSPSQFEATIQAKLGYIEPEPEPEDA